MTVNIFRDVPHVERRAGGPVSLPDLPSDELRLSAEVWSLGRGQRLEVSTFNFSRTLCVCNVSIALKTS